MTLADSRPPIPVGQPVALERLGTRRADGNTLRLALLIAVVLHGVAFLIPLPRRSTPMPSRPEPGPKILRPTLQPPPPPERPPTSAPTTRRPVRMLPVPSLPPDYIEPAPEAVDFPSMVPSETGEVAMVIEPPVAPVPSGPLDETTPGLVLPVRLSGGAKPAYPATARAARYEGTVILEAIIDETGGVTSIAVLDAPAADMGFIEAAREAVSTWRYEPALYGGEPVSVIMTVVVDFRMN